MSSPSSASLLLLHVVVMCPPHQHVHSEMLVSVHSTHPTNVNMLLLLKRHSVMSDVCTCLETCDRGDTREGVSEIHMQ